MNYIAILAVAVSVIIGSGAVTFFMRYGTRLALVERSAKKAEEDSEQNGKDISGMQATQNFMNDALKDIKASLSKLHVIDQIKVTLDAMKEKLDSMVPRAEVEGRLRDLQRQITDHK
jgi:hypothetical protein